MGYSDSKFYSFFRQYLPLIALCIVLTGCRETKFVKPGGSLKELSKVDYQCRKDHSKMRKKHLDGLENFKFFQNAFIECMNSKGWLTEKQFKQGVDLDSPIMPIDKKSAKKQKDKQNNDSPPTELEDEPLTE